MFHFGNCHAWPKKPWMMERATGTHNLLPGTIQVLQMDLRIDATRAQRYREVLSEDENQRADRFYFERDRLRFIAAHAAMRIILSRHLDIMPQELVFSYGIHGKPELAAALSASGLRFNLSHSRERALMAVSVNSRIGVDIEYIDPEVVSKEIAERFFSPREVSTLRALPIEKQPAAFFSCWTRKESYIKAIGGGLSVPLDTFDVAFGPDAPPALICDRGAPPGEQTQWAMYDVSVHRDYAAAIVAEGAEHRLCHNEWNWPH